MDRTRSTTVATLITLLLGAARLRAGCESDYGASGDDTAQTKPPPFDAPVPEHTLLTADELVSGWNELLPGNPTICSRGTKWGFYVRKGSKHPGRIVIDFEGGGACWNDLTCSVAGAIFSENIDNHLAGKTKNYSKGIFDDTRADNPFQGWTHVYIPYCTGDIHWGDATHTYGSGADKFDIHHRGALNSRVALKWVFDNFPKPDQVFVTGCSAGAYGAAGWAPHVMRNYPDVQVDQLGDCGAGVITKGFLKDSFPNWNAEPTMPAWIEGLDPAKVDIKTLEFADLYIRFANANKDRVISQYNTHFDWNQAFYFEQMGGGDTAEWSKQMNASIDRISKAAPSFRYYIAPGHEHCIIVSDSLYSTVANGRKLTDWIGDILAGKKIDSARCKDCGQMKK